MLTILAVGEDFDLLRTRADVLRKTGANVLCSAGAAALKFIAEWEFDLVVLGHSVRQQDAEQISEAAHRQGSKTLVLLLVADRMQEREYDGIDLDARSFVDPACLIRSATSLLELQQHRHQLEIAANTPWSLPVAKKKPASYPADISVRRALLKRFENRKAG
jgi:DNA-binding response OmpR family regulator